MVAQDGLIVLGIDPGLATLGLALLRQRGQSEWDILMIHQQRRHLNDGRAAGPRAELALARMREIHMRLHQAVSGADGAMPQLVAIEAQARAAEGYRKAGKTNWAATYVREVSGIAKSVAWTHGVPVVEIEPADAKSCVTGYRNAGKPQVQRAVAAILRREVGEHAADAAAVAIAGARLAALNALRGGERLSPSRVLSGTTLQSSGVERPPY